MTLWEVGVQVGWIFAIGGSGSQGIQYPQGSVLVRVQV